MLRGRCSMLMAQPGRLILYLGMALLVLSGCEGEAGRKRGTRVLLDEAAILGDITESTEKSLNYLRDDYGIEVVLATLVSPGWKRT